MRNYQTFSELKKHLSPQKFYGIYLDGFKPNYNLGWMLTECRCPFHQDKRPGSFGVNLSTGAYRCFSCGKSGGDILDFYAELNGTTLKEALAALSREFQ